MEKSLTKRLKNTRTDLKANKVRLSKLKKEEKSVFDALQDARIALSEAELAVKRNGDREAFSVAYDKVQRLTEDHLELRDTIRDVQADVEAQEQAFEVLQSEAASDYYPRAMEVINRYRDAEKHLESVKSEWQELNQEYSLAKLEVCRIPRVKKINPDAWSMADGSPENDLKKVKQHYGI